MNGRMVDDKKDKILTATGYNWAWDRFQRDGHCVKIDPITGARTNFKRGAIKSTGRLRELLRMMSNAEKGSLVDAIKAGESNDK